MTQSMSDPPAPLPPPSPDVCGEAPFLRSWLSSSDTRHVRMQRRERLVFNVTFTNETLLRFEYSMCGLARNQLWRILQDSCSCRDTLRKSKHRRPRSEIVATHQQLFILVDQFCADRAPARCSCRLHGAPQLLNEWASTASCCQKPWCCARVLHPRSRMHGPRKQPRRRVRYEGGLGDLHAPGTAGRGSARLD